MELDLTYSERSIATFDMTGRIDEMDSRGSRRTQKSATSPPAALSRCGAAAAGKSTK